VFEPFSPVTINLLRNRIETVLTNYEPRVTLTDVQVEDPEFRLMDNNTLNVRIFFTLKNDPEIQTVDVLLERLR
jgi:phage baseplate assembly protein W